MDEILTNQIQTDDHIEKMFQGWKARFALKADELNKQGKTKEALSQVEYALTMAPDDQYATLVKVRILFAQREYEELVRYLYIVLEKYPDTYRWLNGDYWVGLAYQNIPKHDNDAEYHYKQAINYSKHRAHTYLNLGLIYQKNRRLPEAIDYFGKAAGESPEWSLPWYLRAETLFMMQDVENYHRAAIDFFRKFPYRGIEIMYLLTSPIIYTPLGQLLTPPEEYYHYTKFDALKSIIEHRKLHFTRIDFLNDTTERIYFAEILDSLIADANTDDNFDEDTKRQLIDDLRITKALFIIVNEVVYKGVEIEKSIINNYHPSIYSPELKLSIAEAKEIIENTIKQGIKKYFVLSLTKKKDDLPLWSMYCNNEGYNLELKRDELVKAIVKHRSQDVQFADYIPLQSNILYDHTITYGVTKNLYQMYFSQVEDIKLRIAGLLSYSIVGSTFIKNENFRFEDESRIVIARAQNDSPDSNQEINFRIKNEVFVPYIEVAIGFDNECPIKSITVGPMNKNDTSVPGIKAFLEKQGLLDIEVKKSNVPLR